MKALRRISIPITVCLLIGATFTRPVPATEYPGSFVEWTNFGTYTTGLNVSDTGTVSNVSIFINSAQTQLGFDNNAMLLTSPTGTTIYLFDLSAYKIIGTSLYLTRFIDTAPIIITEGIPPYAGSFRPGESFANFNGEWMTGTWTLAVYNNRPGTANTGAVTDWSLIINQATPVPTPSPVNPTPSPVPIVYREYKGTSFSWTGTSTTLSYISIVNQGVITDVNVNMNATCTSSLDSLGMYLVSPEGTIVGLFNKHDLEESTLYLTTFDDAADQSIKNGLAPYIGLYRPVESLALFNNETMTGEWTLVAYNDSAGNDGTVSDWSLVIGSRDYLATPSPIPTRSPVPTPGRTPTPAGYKTPFPTPQYCYPVIPPEVEASYSGVDITQIPVYIEDNFPVENVDIEVSAWSQGNCITGCDLTTKALFITAPNNVIVKLFGKHDLEEQGLYLTYFDDDAETSILNDIAPYYGPHQPVGLLDKFREEGTWSRGTWVLSWYNDQAADHGMISYFRLCLNRPALTPSPTSTPTPQPPYTPTLTPPGYKTPSPTPSPVVIICKTYSGSRFSWTGVQTVVDTITVPEIGTVDHILLHIQELYCAEDLDNIGMYILSPDGTDVPMFEKHDLSEHQLYLTTFRADATQKIDDTNNVAPYIGSYRPVGSLGDLNGKEITGDWTLVVYNDGPDNGGNVTGWDLDICYAALGPTPPPTPIPSASPTSTPYFTTPTPIEICPVSFGDAFTAPGQEVTWGPISVTYPGLVKKITMKIDRFDVTEGGDLSNVGMWLISPAETVVELFPKHQLSEHSLSATWFDDSAPREITEGLGPYIGRWRPTGSLSDFNGEMIAGTWYLVIFNDFVCVQIPGNPPCEDWARMKENWQLVICPLPTRTPTPTPTAPIPTRTPTPVGYKTPSPAPPTPTPALPVCTDYNGGFFALSDVGTELDQISISSQGVVSSVTVQITARCSGDLDNVGIYLRSPAMTDVPLFEKHDISEHALYKTIFIDDPGYPKINEAGLVSPYLGHYRPSSYERDVNDNCKGGFCTLNNESITGDWSLVVYNDLASNLVEIDEWILTICKVPTPSPTPTAYIPAPTPPPGTPIPVLASGDYNGDGTSDIGIFRPSQGLWAVRGVGTSFFGQTDDRPASGDYDGDGTTDLAVFRPASGLWAIYDITRTYFGRNGDVTIPGDYDGDGRADIAILRPGAPSLWAVKGITRRYFGNQTDIAVPADYDGDWATDLAVFRPSMGLWAVYGVTRAYFGNQTDLPVARDYDGDGTADIGIIRFAPANALWAIKGITRHYFGKAGDYPIPADYLGNGSDYPGIFRRANALWAIKGVTRAYYGKSGDIPIAR